MDDRSCSDWSFLVFDDVPLSGIDCMWLTTSLPFVTRFCGSMSVRPNLGPHESHQYYMAKLLVNGIAALSANLGVFIKLSFMGEKQLVKGI